MVAGPAENPAFKFKYLNERGQETGFLSTKGRFDGSHLHLGETAIPANAIIHVDNRENRVVLSVAQKEGPPATILFAVTGGSVVALKAALGKVRSAAWAASHRDELKSQGREQEFRAVECPHCKATIDLTGFRASPQVNCSFCHSISTLQAPRAEETQYRICDECGMYSKPRKFTIFYFYFLLVVYGWHSRSTWRCPACMRGDAWKMLFGNLVFILGVPVAIVQLIRAYGGADLKSMYRGLDSANLKARKGDLATAISEYRKILESHPHAAGVKYNVGLAMVQQNFMDAAAQTLDAALNDCCNYQPAAQLLAHCYTQLNEPEKLAALKAEWGTAEDGDSLDERKDEDAVE